MKNAMLIKLMERKRESKKNLTIYAIYDLWSDTEECVFAGNVHEIADWLGVDFHGIPARVNRQAKRKKTIKPNDHDFGRYQVFRIGKESEI